MQTHARVSAVAALMLAACWSWWTRTSDVDPLATSARLLHAAATGHLEAVAALMASSTTVRLDAKSASGHSAIHLAVEAGHLPVLSLLLEQGASPDAVGPHRMTPLHIAAQDAHAEAAAVLLRYGANATAVMDGGASVLHVAASMGSAQVVRLLLRAGALVQVLDDNGLPPLHIAMFGGHVNAIRALLEGGAAFTKDASGSSALHHAAQERDMQVGILILEAEPESANLTNAAGATALHIAVELGNEHMARVLLNAGASLHATNLQGFVPLHVSASNGDMALTKLLLERGASINAVGQAGYCPLLLAGQNGHVEVVQALLARQEPHCGAVCPSLARQPFLDDGWLQYFAAAPPSDYDSTVEKASTSEAVVTSTLAKWDASLLPDVLAIELRGSLAEVRVTALASAVECEALIAEAEAHAASHDGWNSKGHHDNYKTTDLEVKEMPAVLGWLNRKLDQVIWPTMSDHFGLAPHHFWLQDCFVVKYELGGQRELTIHQDGSEVTFQVLLSDPQSFTGGGTFFRAANATVRLQQGQMITHFGQTFHSGLPLESGLRYLLVGLVRARPLAEAHALCKRQPC